MKKILLFGALAFMMGCADNSNPEQPADDDLRSVEGTERNNELRSDSATHKNANEQNTVTPEPPSKHGM
jgi:hypothetical protein